MTKVVLILAAALSVSACNTDAQPQTAAQSQPKAVAGKIVVNYQGTELMKVCDGARAVYFVNDDNSAAIAVVENAAECPGTAR